MGNLKNDALEMLARREHSRLELRNKLLRKSHNEEEIDLLLNALNEQNLQSDIRFAEVFTRYRSTKGFGSIKILLELKAKGIDEDIAKDVINNEIYDWHALALSVLEKKFSNKVLKRL